MTSEQLKIASVRILESAFDTSELIQSAEALAREYLRLYPFIADFREAKTEWDSACNDHKNAGRYCEARDDYEGSLNALANAVCL